MDQGNADSRTSSQPVNSSGPKAMEDDHSDSDSMPPPLVADTSSSSEEEEEEEIELCAESKMNNAVITVKPTDNGFERVGSLAARNKSEKKFIPDTFANKPELKEYVAACYNLPSVLDIVPYPPLPQKAKSAYAYFTLENTERFANENPGLSKSALKKLMHKEYNTMSNSSKSKYFRKQKQVEKTNKWMKKNRNIIHTQRKEQMKAYCIARWKRMEE